MKFFFQISTFSIAALTSISVAAAVPSVSDTTGEIKVGSTLTIKGNGFSSNTSEPDLFDLVNNQDLYAPLSDGTQITSENSAWNRISGTNWSRTPPTLVKSGDLRYPNGAAYEGAVSFLGHPETLAVSEKKTLYVSWYFKPNHDVDSGEANKYIRIWDRMDGKGTRISWTTMHMTYQNTDGDGSANWATTIPSANKWSHLEIYVDANNNTIEAQINGEIKHSITDFKKLSESPGLHVELVGFDPRDNAKYADTNFRMNDIYVSSSRARVEISDSPTWNPKSNREIINYTKWSDTSIEATLSNAAMSLPSTYLYVFDKSGSVNEKGFPICGKCPDSVSDFKLD